MRCITRDDLKQYEMLIVKYISSYKPLFCNNAKLKMKQNYSVLKIVHGELFS
jgi:hypothetical protein